jgi:hypothetical protein
LFLEKINIKDRKYEWLYLLASYSTYIFTHLKLMDASNAYSFISSFFLLSLVSMFLFKAKPNILSTGALSYCVLLCWLFYYRGYDTKELHEIALPYLLCASGVTAGIIIASARSQELKFSAFRDVLESAFFTISIGFWPIYPRLFTILHQIG